MIPLLPGLEFLPHLPELLPEDQEFAALRPITPDAVAEVCRLGYMPMGLGGGQPDILLVKCHRRRMVLDVDELHVPQNVSRYARGLVVSVDRQFPDVLTEIDWYHEESWISPALAEAFRALHEHPLSGVRFHSAEVRDPEDSPKAPPVAGEIGYTVGRAYTSLSGYHTRNGSGWVQMVALGRILQQRHAALWDLGMDIPYKRRLGARPVERGEFLRRYRAAAVAAGAGAAIQAAGAAAATGASSSSGAARVAAPGGAAQELLQPDGPVSARELISRASNSRCS